MDKSLSRCVDRVLKENSVEALYIYGSFVNGYYRKDSDIDLVALTSQNSRDKPVEMRPNISVHLIHPFTLQLFETGHPYSHLRMVHLYNEEKCVEISDRMKSELVRRELVRFRKAGIEKFEVLDPLNNYLWGYGFQRPWRIKPIKRIFASDESQRILREEYQRVLGLLEQRGMVSRTNGKYSINKDYVFDEEFKQPKDSFLFKAKNSYGGWHYLRNAISMADFARRRK
ncbi:nucleotidyltransferase domain-containing protein [Candidatus Pacearchaeota archaeon]|nr:nucleotidyltransferase domain-containing protein [Candidatus Pacearchaeota archaeon]